MRRGAFPFGCPRVVDTGINADVVKNIIINRRQSQWTIFLVFLARIHPKRINNGGFVRDSELGAIVDEATVDFSAHTKWLVFCYI